MLPDWAVNTWDIFDNFISRKERVEKRSAIVPVDSVMCSAEENIVLSIFGWRLVKFWGQ